MTKPLLAALCSLVAAASMCLAVGAAGADAHASAAVAVTIHGYRFTPSPLTVHVGDTVTWTNQDTAPHDVTSTAGPQALQSPTLHTGESWHYTFTAAGTYSYICSIHPDMTASLTVVAPAAPPTSVTSSTTRPAGNAATVTSAAPGSTTTVPMSGMGGMADAAPSDSGAPAGTVPASAEPAPAAVPASSTRPSVRLSAPLWVTVAVVGVVIAALLLLWGEPAPSAVSDADDGQPSGG
jgi:plastocyanin